MPKTAQSNLPTPPAISPGDIREQFKLDVFDKEVQSAATYSYLWIADQVGHIGLAVVLQMLAYNLHQLLDYCCDMSWISANWFSLLLVASVVAVWEWLAYRQSANLATGRFPLNKKGLRRNAVIATLYMWFGVVIGFGFHLGPLAGTAILIGILAVALIPIPWWMRQKMTWQKAALPYLSRLASVRQTITQDDAKKVLEVLKGGAPPKSSPRQIIIFGSIGSGRTSLAAGIGTEFAFAGNKVRYLSLDKFVELVGESANYPGPRNVGYWPWVNAQVLVIDDVSVALEPMQKVDIDVDQVTLFRRIMQGNGESGWGCLKDRHSIWVVGDVEEDRQAWVDAITQLCSAVEAPVVVGLSPENEI